jgi:hypothetical protein
MSAIDTTDPLLTSEMILSISENNSSKEMAIAAIKEITTQMVKNATDLSKFDPTIRSGDVITKWNNRLTNAAKEAEAEVKTAEAEFKKAEEQEKTAKTAYENKYKTTDITTRTFSHSKEHTEYLAAIYNKQRAHDYLYQAKEKAVTAEKAQNAANQSKKGGKKSSKNKVSRVKSTK